ncbi:unnamed protein product [Staurois parvus]|uniref:Uncharacterized protein n=1 Tax=Staurois parvus TaxID=386267 RepID=A0ABN9GWL2_9NEOB|nr:unnamed protein product [Staurois parvus]
MLAERKCAVSWHLDLDAEWLLICVLLKNMCAESALPAHMSGTHRKASWCRPHANVRPSRRLGLDSKQPHICVQLRKTYVLRAHAL